LVRSKKFWRFKFELISLLELRAIYVGLISLMLGLNMVISFIELEVLN